jgi:hypothetical protein
MISNIICFSSQVARGGSDFPVYRIIRVVRHHTAISLLITKMDILLSTTDIAPLISAL